MGILGYARSTKVGLSALIGFGNKLDLNESDTLEFFAQDNQTKAIAVHMESVKQGRRFIQALRRASLVKPVVILKAGRTKGGGRAAISHTGAMLSPDEVVDAAIRRAGGIRAKTLQDFFDIARGLSTLSRPKGENVMAITGAGGLGVLLSDACDEYNVQLMETQGDLKDRFRKIVPTFGSLNNPIDITGASPPETYYEAIRIALMDERVHSLILGYWHTIITRPLEFAKVVIEAVEEARSKGVNKPIVASLSGDVEVEQAAKMMEARGIIAYPYAPERAVMVLASLVSWCRNSGRWQR
jgi:acyl-CoA synthetase (NDP forming)